MPDATVMIEKECFDLVWFGLVWFGLVWFGLMAYQPL